jgi:competence ComEA-like helix-hairpin-helix protein
MFKTWMRFRTCTVLLAALTLSPAAPATTKKPPLVRVNINSANSEELQQVPGIGPVTAGKILQMRKSYGPFKSVDDLLAIKGLGRKRLDKMRKYMTVGKAASKSSAPANTAAATPNSKPANAPPKQSPANPPSGADPEPVDPPPA